MRKTTWMAGLLILALVLSLTGCGGEKKVEAPKFPTKPISIIVPYGAGGGTDAIARAMAKSAEPIFGQPVTIINKVGANGAVGMTDGVNAAADGYTVTAAAIETVLHPIMGNVKWKVDDYKSILMTNSDPISIAVRADSPYKTLAELIAAAKQKPESLKLATLAPGAITHLAGLSFQENTGAKFTIMPFPSGGAAAITDLLGGHADAACITAAEMSQHVKAGKIRLLAILDGNRMKGFPNVPTAKEQGYDMAFSVWRGMTVPAKTPDAVVKVLHDGFKKAMEDPNFIAFMEKGDFGIRYDTGANFHTFMNNETKLLTPLLKQAGLIKKQQ
ncbi:MAG: transporter substrate-binding protein [Anaerosporomusa subterranea]|nr:transporter substrate-binding protein [Anaerosporomusa subterranea]